MEMCYSGALVMPSSYAMMDEEEMMYLEGGGIGKNWYNSTGFIGVTLDVAFICITTGASLCSMAAIKRLIRKNRKKMVKRIEGELYKYIGSAVATAASAAIDIALTITGTSIGGLIAEGLDRVDKKNDNYIFA